MSQPLVFENNGSLGARRAHFNDWAHVFRTCAPDVHTFFHQIVIAIYHYIPEECTEKFPGSELQNECTRGALKIKGYEIVICPLITNYNNIFIHYDLYDLLILWQI